MLTSIIILTHNQLAYTKECIESIRKYTSEENYEIIVIDNASTDGSVEWLEEQQDILLEKNEYNAGFPKGCNQGIKISKGDNILLLNNDVVVTAHWLTNLLKCLYAAESTGAVGPVTNQAAYYSTIPTVYKNMMEMQEFANLYNQSNDKKWEERLKLIGFCMLIKRTVLDDIGLLDEQFTPGNYEDDDISIRMLKKGYKLYICKDTFIHHYGSRSWKEDISNFSIVLNENHNKFFNKWGFYSNDLFIHYDLLGFVDKYFYDEAKILEIGCGCGGTLLEMKRRYKSVILYGVESNQYSAEFSKMVAPTYITEYTNLQDVFEEKMFNIVVISKTIEKEIFKDVYASIQKVVVPNGITIMSSINLQTLNSIKTT